MSPARLRVPGSMNTVGSLRDLESWDPRYLLFGIDFGFGTVNIFDVGSSNVLRYAPREPLTLWPSERAIPICAQGEGVIRQVNSFAVYIYN